MKMLPYFFFSSSYNTSDKEYWRLTPRRPNFVDCPSVGVPFV
jgi:hypothetical protein